MFDVHLVRPRDIQLPLRGTLSEEHFSGAKRDTYSSVNHLVKLLVFQAFTVVSNARLRGGERDTKAGDQTALRPREFPVGRDGSEAVGQGSESRLTR
jgi:hypothetical protein